ncbi:MAG: UvrB/UvrC motif-containing protein, partial [Candidatus Omnitrophica bacterium]|nr:UvrB/UvrC motif-containing protein [Candidatus Omnitrophota bacterium]
EQMNELHLCEECARQKSVAMEQQFGLSDLLAGMTDFDKLEKEAEPITGLKCPNCGLSYADFKKIGRLGCGNCYSTFSKYLEPLLKRIHGSTQHTGKSPFKAARDLKKKAGTQELRIRLQKAIESEAFEEAAKLRDQIKAVENKKEK